MNVRTQSRILLSTFVLAAIGAGCYVLTYMASFRLFGIILVILGIGLLLWIWKPWKRFQDKGQITAGK